MAPSENQREAQQALERFSLPDGTSPDLELVLASPDEARECALLNKVSWSGPLSEEAYLRREDHLASIEATANGQLSGWILVSRNDTKSPRTILSACESLRKRAIVASRGGEVKEVQAFGIASVYCRDEYRGKGYAVRMMSELRRKLETWQQQDGKTTDFTVLYSDIGKKFYAKNGWIPYPSAHMSLKPNAKAKAAHQQTRPLRSRDLPELCRRDKELLKQKITKFAQTSPDTRVALIPSAQIMDWHHAREDFLAKEILGRTPEIRGAIVAPSNEKAVWVLWTRLFQKNPDENSLQILRIVVEDEDGTSEEPSSTGSVQNVAACLAAAQEEAAAWGVNTIELWNPSATVQAGVRMLRPGVELIHREEYSVACLNWYGDKPGTNNVEWVANEKFGWC